MMVLTRDGSGAADQRAAPSGCAHREATLHRTLRVRSTSETGRVPLIDITHDPSVDEAVLRRLVRALPDLVAEAVDCPEEPWVGPPESGDIEIRVRERSRLDVGELSVVIEVRTKLFPSRVGDKQRRADLLRDGISALNLSSFGVWLILAEGAWVQA
jgi:hypothetical protein